MAKDKCIMCGEETQYDFDTSIDYRIGYIEGAGQLCGLCYNQGTDREMIMIPKNLILDNPNNMALGEAVRRYYNELYS
jgi:hypothetical protein